MMTSHQPRSRRARLRCLCAGLFLLAACSSPPAEDPLPAAGDPATWALVAPARVSEESRTLDIEATRVACASGRTGEVLEQSVSYEPELVDGACLDDEAASTSYCEDEVRWPAP